MADIGEPLREVTFEPIEHPQPLTAPAPAEPVQVPEREPVPA